MLKNNSRGNKPRKKPYKIDIKRMNKKRVITCLCKKYSFNRGAGEEIYKEMELINLGGKYKEENTVSALNRKYRLWINPCNRESRIWVKR